MSRRIEQTALARHDVVEIAAWIGQSSPQAAHRFLDAAEVTFAQLGEMPRIGRRRPHPDLRLTEVRWWRVAGFNDYIVLYAVTDDSVLILRVLHGARDIDQLLGEHESG